MAGKGDKPRKVNKKQFDENWEQINWKSKKKEKNEPSNKHKHNNRNIQQRN